MKRFNWNYLNNVNSDSTKVQLHPYYGCPLFIEVSLCGGRHYVKDSNTFQVIGTGSWTVETSKRKLRSYIKELNIGSKQ